MSKPFYQTEGEIWLNGTFIDIAQAQIPALTHGLHYASSVFEGERAYDYKIFKSKQHTKRLINSCKLLGFDLPLTVEEFETAKRDTLKRSGLRDAYVRAFAWKGGGEMGVGSGDNTINVAISMWEMSPYFEAGSDGIRLGISSWRRPPPECAPVKAKAAGLYTICTLAKDNAVRNGYDDAVMLDIKGRVAECTGAHIILIRDGALYTPKPDWMIDGITRATIVEIAAKNRIQVTEAEILPDDLGTFSECFIVGSAVEVVPVSQIESTQFRPGAMTRFFMDEYAALIRAHA